MTSLQTVSFTRAKPGLLETPAGWSLCRQPHGKFQRNRHLRDALPMESSCVQILDSQTCMSAQQARKNHPRTTRDSTGGTAEVLEPPVKPRFHPPHLHVLAGHSKGIQAPSDLPTLVLNLRDTPSALAGSSGISIPPRFTTPLCSGDPQGSAPPPDPPQPSAGKGLGAGEHRPPDCSRCAATKRSTPLALQRSGSLAHHAPQGWGRARAAP